MLAQTRRKPAGLAITAHLSDRGAVRDIERDEEEAFWTTKFAARLGTWLCISAFSAVVGLDVRHSLPEFFRGCFYFLLPFCIYQLLQKEKDSNERLRKIKSYLVALTIGQGIAALLTIISAVSGRDIHTGVPGAVTESGQLVLVLPCIVALLYLYRESAGVSCSRPTQYSAHRPGNGFRFCALFSALLFMAWCDPIIPPPYSGITPIVRTGGAVFCLALLLPAVFEYIGRRRSCSLADLALAYERLGWCIAALLFTALVINLKRGPWIGVTVELLVLGAFLSRKLFFTAIAVIPSILLLLPPARARLFSSFDHFEIQGGRKSMWLLGLELSERFPLGLGPNNASYMRQLDPTLPELHRHMHNNLLNISVETGLLGLAAYIWWIVFVISLGFLVWRRFAPSGTGKNTRDIQVLGLCLGTSLLGWQVSGIVEYNFGDGEIRLIALVLMGFLLTLISLRRTPEYPTSNLRT